MLTNMNPQDGTTDNPSSSFTFAWCPRSEGARIVFVLILASTFFMSRPHFGIYWVAFTFFFLTAIRYGWFCLIRPPHPKTTGRWWQTPGAVAAGFCIFLFIFFRPPKDSAKPSESSKTQVTANNSTPRQPPSLPPPPAGIQQSELAIASQTIYGAWVEEDPIVDDTLSWTGTTFVWGAVTDKPGKLLLVTNVHCLGLKALFDADVASDPEIKSYGLAVKFSTGVAVPVERFGIQEDGVDIAILVIDAQKVRRGTDYTTLLFDDAAAIAPGAATGPIFQRSCPVTHREFGKSSPVPIPSRPI